MAHPEPFEAERQAYDARFKELLPYVGKFAVILGDEISGPHDTFEAALSAGYELHGLKPFMVKRVAIGNEIHNL